MRHQRAKVEHVQGRGLIELTSDDICTYNAWITKTFGVSCPEDFFSFYNHLSSHCALASSKNNGCQRGMIIEMVSKELHIELMGPFRCKLERKSGGKISCKDENQETHFIDDAYDPPELLTFARSTEYHWGYYRDSPTSAPSMIVQARNTLTLDILDTSLPITTFEPVAQNLFQLLHLWLQERKKKTIIAFDHPDCVRWTPEQDKTYEARRQAVISPTLHQVGICCPKTQFRALPYTRETLLRVIQDLNANDAKQGSAAREKLAHWMTRINMANDECDFGTGLVFGLDLFMCGPAVEKEAFTVLDLAYVLLGRSGFCRILKQKQQLRQKLRISPKIG